MGNMSDYYLQCLNCRHYLFGDGIEGHFCLAFPDGNGIPKEIIEGDFDHRTSYPGDNGIRMVLKPKNERVWIY
jgi:hypothetical protein